MAGANLFCADLSDADLSEANLAETDLNSANLSGANLSGAKMTGSILTGATLSTAYMDDANLAGAKLFDANLKGTWLLGANFATADLSDANLQGAYLDGAIFTSATLLRANLTEADCEHSRFENADLRFVHGLRLNTTYIRGAQFSPVASRWWARISDQLPRLQSRAWGRGWYWIARQLDYQPSRNDLWSVLRQTYGGPRMWFLFFYVIMFTFPYIARVAVYSTVASAEKRLLDWADVRERDLRSELSSSAISDPAVQTISVKLPSEMMTVAIEGKPVVIQVPSKNVEVSLSMRQERRKTAERELAVLESTTRQVQPKPLWQAVLKWNKASPWPAILGIALIIYNVGLYWIISAVSPLRDEEERTGWSPAWKDYGYIRWIHWVVTIIFYISLSSFVWTSWAILNRIVWVP